MEQYVKGFQRFHTGEDVQPVTSCKFLLIRMEELFIIEKIRSQAKYLHFCELNMKTGKSLRDVSLLASSLVVYCL